MMFEYTATSPYELSISEGETVKILEEDDGSGWVKVGNGSGGKGLVPASYVEAVGHDRKRSNVTPRTSAQYGGYRLSFRRRILTLHSFWQSAAYTIIRQRVKTRSRSRQGG